MTAFNYIYITRILMELVLDLKAHIVQTKEKKEIDRII